MQAMFFHASSRVDVHSMAGDGQAEDADAGRRTIRTVAAVSNHVIAHSGPCTHP
jgi:hypothetical protein